MNPTRSQLLFLLLSALALCLTSVSVWMMHSPERYSPAARNPSFNPAKDVLIECLTVPAHVPFQNETDDPQGGTRTIVNAVEKRLKRTPDGRGGGARWNTTYGPVVVLTYSACHGALSQHYGHLSALVVASYVGPDVLVLPHARSRKTYASRNLLGNKDPDGDNAWAEIPLHDIYEVGSFSEYLGPGTAVLPFPTKPGKVDLPNSYSGYATHWIGGLAEKLGFPTAPVLQITYKRRRAGWVWREIINRKILSYWREKVVIVDLGCTDIMVGANPSFGAVEEDIQRLQKAHKVLRIAPYLRSAAGAAVDMLKEKIAGSPWIGLHLRVERDMFADNSINRWWKAYMRSKRLFLDPRPHPILVASGIFEYLSGANLSRFLAPYRETHRLFHICVSDGLPNDVRPWIDYLALAQASYFQGHEYSVLSWLVVQERILSHHRGLDTSSLIRKKGYTETAPSCCENDRCLSTVCSVKDEEPAIDFKEKTAEVTDELPPVVLDIPVKQ